MRTAFGRLGQTPLTFSCALATALYAMSVLPVPAAGAFAGFPGTWSGTGEVGLADGSREAIRCKATYKADDGAQSLDIHVVCASDSFKVDLASEVQASGSVFSGNWQEVTRQVQGTVRGTLPAGGEMQANLDGTGFAIQLAAATNGKEQAVTIVSQGTDVQHVKITMHKD